MKKRLRNKEWRERNKENLKIKKKMDYLKNRERLLEYYRQYRLKKKESNNGE